MGADWGKLALIHAMIGYEANVLGLMSFSARYNDDGNCNNCHDTEIQAMLILGFLIYTAGGILMALTKLGGLGASIIFTILSICAFIFAAIFIFVGVGLHGDDAKEYTDVYSSTLEATAGVLGLLASVFLLLALFCKGKGGSTSPS